MITPARAVPVLERIDRTGLAGLGPEWDALVAASANPGPFLTSAWIGAWLATLGSEADLEVVTARDADDGSLIAAAPFFVEPHTRAGVRYRVLRFIGSGPAAPDHLDLPVVRRAPPGTAAAVWAAVNRNRRWDVVDLDGVAADGILARLLVRRSGDRGRVERILTPFLRLRPTWDATAATFDGALRSSLDRQRRRLDRDAAGPVCERMVAAPGDLEESMTRLERLHQSVRAEAGQRGAFGTPLLAAFQREVARRMLAAGRLRLWRLDVGDQTIAAIECFRHADTVSFYTTGYDREWQRYGPGSRVMAVAIGAAIAEGAAEFDFLRGDEPYKRSWGSEVRHDLRIVHPASRLGRLLVMARDLRRRRTAA
jgi:CelD/BcsL family acetyltransferase involved in cellulose biosynthesis